MYLRIYCNDYSNLQKEEREKNGAEAITEEIVANNI